MIGLLLTWIAGFEGIPIPYSPKLDDGITVLLLCCFFMSAYVLSRSRKFLVQLVKDFLLNRERTSIFAATTATDMRYMLLLILQTCVLASVCTFNSKKLDFIEAAQYRDELLKMEDMLKEKV